jgi:hypothetical protein
MEDGVNPGTRNILTKVLLKLFDPVSVYWEHERNLVENQDVKTVCGFMYESQCWSVNCSYTLDRTMHEREYFVEIGLYGLGEFGVGK